MKKLESKLFQKFEMNKLENSSSSKITGGSSCTQHSSTHRENGVEYGDPSGDSTIGGKSHY